MTISIEDMFDYVTWINWRQAYHEARKVYHSNMSEFYTGQIDLVVKTQKNVVDLWTNSISMMQMMKQFPIDIMGLWKK